MIQKDKHISANDLITAIRDDVNIDGRTFARVKEHIEEAKAVDAVEVVRCKDCKHCTEIGLPRCRRTGRNMLDDDFCSRGERRERAVGDANKRASP